MSKIVKEGEEKKIFYKMYVSSKDNVVFLQLYDKFCGIYGKYSYSEFIYAVMFGKLKESKIVTVDTGKLNKKDKPITKKKIVTEWIDIEPQKDLFEFIRVKK